MPVRFYPMIFVLLWASAFVAAKYGLMGAGPFSFLFTRFAIVSGIFGLMVLVMQSQWPSRKVILPTLAAGVLMHGVYLGGCFYAISRGTPAGTASLIVSIQPILTALLALYYLGEKVRLVQWLGIVLGMLGVSLVVAPSLGGNIPLIGLMTCLFAVTAMSIGTIIQKRFVGTVDLVSDNFLQAVAASAFFGILLMTIEEYRLVWSVEVTLAMTWIVATVSVGAITILMILIRTGQMAATSSLFFMVPPVSAIMSYFAFGETLSYLDILGFIIACFGVWLVNKPEKV